MSSAAVPVEKGSEYGLVRHGILQRVRFVRIEAYRSWNHRVHQMQYRTYFVVLTDGLPDQKLVVGGEVDHLVPWADWVRATRTATDLGLDGIPTGTFQDGWQLTREQVRAVGRLVDQHGGTDGELARDLNWPLVSKRPWFGEPYWPLTLAQAIRIADYLT